MVNKQTQIVHTFSLLTDHDIYLFREGNHFRLYEKLGSHIVENEGIKGVYFAVWAPNADSVSVIGDFNNKGSKTSLMNPFPGMVFTYISKDMELAELAKYLENSNNTKRLGQLLGYPDCCIDFFIQNMEEQSLGNNDFVLPALKNSSGFVFKKELNIAARYFDSNILPFFPHSFSCNKALKMSRSFLKTIEKHDPKIGEDLKL